MEYTNKQTVRTHSTTGFINLSLVNKRIESHHEMAKNKEICCHSSENPESINLNKHVLKTLPTALSFNIFNVFIHTHTIGLLICRCLVKKLAYPIFIF